ncbi:glycosyltransferase family 4 protein [Cellulomonas sp. P5_E12]
MPVLEPLRAGLVVEQLWQPAPGGSGTYIVELLRALATRDDVRAVGLAARHRAGPHDDWAIDVPVVRSRLPRTALYQSWQSLHRPRVEGRVPSLDVVHATTWALPATRRPLVVTVHDLAFLERPQLFTDRGNAFFRRALQEVLDRAAAVIVPSQATADECREAGIDDDRLTVVPHGVTVVRPDATQIAAARRRYADDRPYVMWAGTTEPRKNVRTLLAAYAELARDPEAPDLLLVGPPGWGEPPAVPDAVRARVRVTGRVDRVDLHALYAGARAFAFPSLSEGFGLPVLEAMSHGTPVVTSFGTACAEVVGDAGLTVGATDAGALADALREAIGPRHDELAARGLQRAARFSWARSAEETLRAYRSVVRTGRA